MRIPRCWSTTPTPFPVKNAPAAEYLTVRDGLIVGMRIIFDRAPFDAARRAAAAG